MTACRPAASTTTPATPRDAEEIARLTRGTETLRALLQRLEWDKAGYCPLCFPGEAPYRHTEDCPLGRALEAHP